MEGFCQIWIIILGGSAIWFVSRLEDWRKWGYVLGLLSQPAWFYTALVNKQWGILLLSVWYTYAWGSGVYNFWIKDKG